MNMIAISNGGHYGRLLTIILILLIIGIAGNLGRKQDERETKRIQGMSIEQLEEILKCDNNHALELHCKTTLSADDNNMLKHYSEESKAIALELHRRKGKKYKDADEICAEASRQSAKKLSPEEQAAAAKALLASIAPEDKEASVVEEQSRAV